MREVSKEEFYTPIYAKGLNVHPQIVGNHPHTSFFRYLDKPGSAAYGKIVDDCYGGKSYFIGEPA